MKSTSFSKMISLFSVIVALTVGNWAAACPFCSAPSLTLSEQVTQANAVVLVKWVGGQAAKISDSGSTEFEVLEVVKQPEKAKLVPGGKIQLVRYRAAKPNDEFMLFGTELDDGIEWGSPLEVSKTAYEYMKNSPKPSTPASDRLKYFIQYLETGDKMVSDDAFGEFANAAYADVAKLGPNLPREQLRKWLSSDAATGGRMGLYGMMLGLCGNADDVTFLEKMILQPTDDFRLGIDGIMGGYLLLTGDRGLKTLEEEKLKNKKAPFSETYAAMQAVRFMWQYGDNRISPDRLKESMRILLDRPELADLVIADLSRMKDWFVQDKLFAMYDDEANIPSVKRAIVRYMLTSIKDTGEKKDAGEKREDNSKAGGAAAIPSGSDRPAAELPAHVIRGKQYLAELEKKDPKTVTEAKRFFVMK